MFKSVLGDGVGPHAYVLNLHTVLGREGTAFEQSLEDGADEIRACVVVAPDHVL